MIYWPDKIPAAVVDLGADWHPTLAKVGDPTIVGSVWTVLAGNVSVVASSIDPNAKETLVRISGGTQFNISHLRNTVTLSDGQVLWEDALIKVI